ncbi:unnamed protein product [Allacma fusca]|uniref:Transposase n=1 Tax=Allacma fusca TaxID=39272 RepID=A0A8J2PKX4_9HEXA|nr:unnamed protein product [Allacma fusca]
MALSKLCEDEEPLHKLIPTKDFNTTGLVNHLVFKHHVLKVFPNSLNSGSDSGVGAKASTQKTSFGKPKSRPLRRLLNSEFGQIPSSHPVTIIRRFVKFAKTIQAYIKAGGKYIITLDEWTSEPIPASFKSEDCRKLVEKRLESLGLKLQTDIIFSTNDGANMMKKFGIISKIINQLCFAHGMHLSVMDTLYKARKDRPNSKKVQNVIEEPESVWTDIEEDNQSKGNADEIHKEQVSSDESENDCESESAFDLSKSDNLEL